MIEVVIHFESAAKPGDDPIPTHTEKEEFGSMEEAKGFIKKHVNVDDLKKNGRDTYRFNDDDQEHVGRRYGYWSLARDRETGKKWYEWANVWINQLDRRSIAYDDTIGSKESDE